MREFIAKDTGEPLVVLGGYSIARDGSIIRQAIKHTDGDYGADPLGDGRFRMIPSGDIVTAEERDRRLK